MSAVAAPFQLLEINIISALDLEPISKPIKAYAVAWLHPERKLATQVDQIGHTNPTWNEKFVFRVDDEFLNSDSSLIMIEIYTTAWLRDVLIGTVGVHVNNLIPASARSGSRKSKLPTAALQIRRPSGRPQGILNIGMTLLDSTMRSMPIYSDLSTSEIGYWDRSEPNNNKRRHNPNEDAESYCDNSTITESKLLMLQRCQSEKNDSTINDYTYTRKQGNGYALESNGSDVSVPIKDGVLVNANGSLCSDVGPSPSVVAEAIAKGLYPVPMPARAADSSEIDGCSDHNSIDMVNKKIERWRTEVTPAYGRDESEIELELERKKKLRKTPRRTDENGGNGLFSCFGKVFGCEISITCGGGGGGGKQKKKKNNKRHRGNANARLTAESELTYGSSSI